MSVQRIADDAARIAAYFPADVKAYRQAADNLADARQYAGPEIIADMKHQVRELGSLCDEWRKELGQLATAVFLELPEVANKLRLLQRVVPRWELDELFPWDDLVDELRRIEAAALRHELAIPPDEERNRYVYHRAMDGDGWDKIGAAVRQRSEWEPLNTANGVKAAATRYASKNNLPKPNKRRKGRQPGNTN